MPWSESLRPSARRMAWQLAGPTTRRGGYSSYSRLGPMSSAAEGQWWLNCTPPLQVVGPASCQAIRRAEGWRAADQGEHTLYPDAVPVRCPAEEGVVHLPGRDGFPCPSPSSCINPRRRFTLTAPWFLHRLLPNQTVVFASPASPSSDRSRHLAVPQGIFRQQGEHAKANVLQDAAEIRRGGGFVIPDTEGTSTFVTISCQLNQMKWNISMILAGSIGFLGVSSMIWGTIPMRAGHHYLLSILLRGCSSAQWVATTVAWPVPAPVARGPPCRNYQDRKRVV